MKAVCEEIDSIVESIVEAARIPSRRRRDELRRELRSHFEESGTTPEALHSAVARFGSAAAIGSAFRNVYRGTYWLFYFLKVGTCLAGATIAALSIETIVNIRHDPMTWHLSPEFSRAAAFAIILSFALVAAVEATRTPVTWVRMLVAFGCLAIVAGCAVSVDRKSAGALVVASIMASIGASLARAATAWTSRAVLTLVAFAVAEFLWHRFLGVTLGAVRALSASATLLMVWASTITIVACSDRAFSRAFRTR